LRLQIALALLDVALEDGTAAGPPRLSSGAVQSGRNSGDAGQRAYESEVSKFHDSPEALSRYFGPEIPIPYLLNISLWDKHPSLAALR
jgi:hypothetical protein